MFFFYNNIILILFYVVNITSLRSLVSEVIFSPGTVMIAQLGACNAYIFKCIIFELLVNFLVVICNNLLQHD